MSGIRATSFWNEMNNRNLIESNKIIINDPVLATEKELLLFHSQNYINFVKQSSEKGIGLLDNGDTPVFKGMFEASKYVVGSTLNGLHLIMNKKVDHVFNPIGGFHHARINSAAGFCVFNDPAIAIIEAKKKYGLKRILYIDIDAHHGDGVFYSFLEDPEVFIIDIHEDGNFLYPGTGSEDETGDGEAKGTKMNIPIPPGTDHLDFKKTFDKAEKFIMKIKPELILFQCGGDCLKNDPTAHLEYTSETYRFAAEKIHKLAHKFAKGRILAMGGGGYSPDNTAKAWVNVVEVFINDK